MENTPIVENEAIRLPYGDDDYILVAASCDSIQMFPDEQYNYLRVYDEREREMKAMFLSRAVLASLFDMGIPATKRQSITQSEHDLWVDAQTIAAMRNIDEELRGLTDEA